VRAGTGLLTHPSLLAAKRDGDLIAMRGFSPSSGARFLKRFIDTRIKLPVTLDWHKASRFTVCVRDGEISVEAAAPRLAVVDCAEACSAV